MIYKVELTRNAKVNGKRYKISESVSNVSEKLFNELKERELVASFEEVANPKFILPKYENITVDQIKEKLTELKVDHENITDKKELYALLETSLKAGE